MGYIGFFIGLYCLLFVVNKITNKIFRVEKIRNTNLHDEKIKRWGNNIIFIVLLITLWFVIGGSDILKTLFFMGFMALFLGFQAIMEYIFTKESRQYISNIILMIIVLVTMLYLFCTDAA